MTKKQILDAAKELKASDFIALLNRKKVFFDVLDQDNLLDLNDGLLNIEVDGMPDGEALLFMDGEFLP